MARRAIVCGGRSYDDHNAFDAVMAVLHAEEPFALIISGHARGADAMGENWARRHRVPLIIEPARWDEHARAAGPIRNQKMLDDHAPNCVVAFPGGRGTLDMVTRARFANVPVIDATRISPARSPQSRDAE